MEYSLTRFQHQKYQDYNDIDGNFCDNGCCICSILIHPKFLSSKNLSHVICIR
uniref:Uncharacterized protein n=1 Tax=Tetranychus urticae TaxID=32264 RepID=T1KH08_TETUR